MRNKKNNNKINAFEEQLKEIREYQKNAFNPGYYIGTGRVNLATKNLLRSPKILIILGCIILIPTIYNIVNNFNIVTVSHHLMQIILGTALVVGGIIRLRRKKF
ncbi:hypothetical protein GCM10008905_27810 [Clostridium malenominatum]|uniref:Uncharacterized protein n=1 Tax=Clostridium malenominatum TaxID=1539 RepID=A0ABN1J4L9_9CLOT